MTKPTKICMSLSCLLGEKSPLLSSRFILGEIYLFHCTNPLCPPESSLWGIFDKLDKDGIYLESSTSDLFSFRMWHPLPEVYNFCRRASRSELRDYIAAMTSNESASFKGTKKLITK